MDPGVIGESVSHALRRVSCGLVHGTFFATPQVRGAPNTVCAVAAGGCVVVTPQNRGFLPPRRSRVRPTNHARTRMAQRFLPPHRCGVHLTICHSYSSTRTFLPPRRSGVRLTDDALTMEYIEFLPARRCGVRLTDINRIVKWAMFLRPRRCGVRQTRCITLGVLR